MSTPLASLIVSLEANTAQFTTNMNAAGALTNRVGSTISSAANVAKTALIGLAGAFTIGAAASWAQGVISAASALDDLAESTGSSVESLSRLTNQARVAGVPFDSFSTAINKLAAGMNGVDDESTKIGATLKQLGITAKDPADAFTQIALTMDKYANGTGKAAALADLFGKNWASVMPALKAVVEQQAVQGTVTAQQAAEAQKLEQSWRKLSDQGGLLKTMLLSDIVPALNRWIEGVRIARAEGLGWLKSLDVGTSYADRLVPSIFALREEIAGIEKNMAQVKKQGREWFLPGLQKDIDEKTKELKGLEAILLRMSGWPGDNSGAAPVVKEKPTLDYKSSAAAVKAVAQAVADYADEIQKLNDVMVKASGSDGGYTNLIRVNEIYQRDLRAGKQINLDQVRELMRTAVAADEQAISLKATADQWQAYDEAVKRSLATQTAIDDAIMSANMRIKEQNDALQLEHDTLLMSANERARYITNMALAKATTEGNVNAVALLTTQLEKLNQQAADIAFVDSIDATKKALAAQAEEWKRTYEKIESTITDALMRGFEKGKSLAANFRDTVVSMFKTLVLRPIIQGIVSPVAAGIAGALGSSGASASGGGSPLGVLGNIGSIFGNSASTLSMFGSDVSQLMGSGIGVSQAISTALAGAGGFGAVFAAAVPWVSLAAIAIPLISKLFNKGDAQRTADFASNTALGSGNPLFQSSSAFGTFGLANDKWFSNEMAAQLAPLLQTIGNLDNAIAAAVGPALTDKIKQALSTSAGYNFGTEHTDLNATGVSGAILKDRYTTVLNAIDSQLGALLTTFKGTGEEMAQFVVGLIGMNKVMSDSATMTKLFGASFDIPALQATQKSGEAITDTFARLAATFAATNLVAFVLGKNTATAFGAIGLASTAAREDLINLAGGIDALTAQTSFYYDSFLTDADRIALALPEVTATMASLGLSSVTTRDQFKELVKGIDLSTEGGRALYAALMKVAPAFFLVTSAVTATANAVTRNAIHIVNGLRSGGPIQERSTTPRGLEGPGPTGHGNLTGRNAPGAPTRGFAGYFATWAAQIAQAEKDVAALIAVNPIVDALKANGSQWEKLNQQGASFDSLITFYDGSTLATTNLTQATGEYYQSLVQMLAVIDQLKASIAGMFADSIRFYKMDGMDPHQQYKYLQEETKGLYEQLGKATDPNQINSIAQQINANQRTAYGLLTPEERNQVRGQFIEAATTVSETAQKRFDAAEAAAEAKWDKFISEVRTAITEAGSPIKEGGLAVQAGGALIARAAAVFGAATARGPVPIAPRQPRGAEVNA